MNDMKPKLYRLHILPFVASAILLTPGRTALAQTSPVSQSTDASTTDPIAFDVVSVHPSDPNHQQESSLRFTDDGLRVINLPLDVLIRMAYRAGFETKVQGLPGWTSTTHYDIEARVPGAEVAEYKKLAHDFTPAGKERRNALLNSVLAERFKLTAHHESREGTVYAFVVGKGGPKLQKAEGNEPPSMIAIPHGHIEVKNATVAAVAPFFAQELGHSVTDKTGLTGNYNFTLNWSPDQGTTAAENAGPSIFTAVEEQLGLKLEAIKGPVDTIVVDHIEKPSEN